MLLSFASTQQFPPFSIKTASEHPSTYLKNMADIMPWLVSMRKLDRYNIMSTYDRWAEEVQALLSISGVAKAITEKGTQGDELARGIIMLSLERDLRETMAGKVNTGTALDLWNGVKKAKKVLEDEEKAFNAKSPRNLSNDFSSLNVGGSTSGWA